MKITKQRGERLVCPHCHHEHEEPVEDFTISGRPFGSATRSESECVECDEPFLVEQTSEDEFVIFD